MLRAIERATRQVIEPMNLPSVDAVDTLRIASSNNASPRPSPRATAIFTGPCSSRSEAESGLPLMEIAAALASLSQGTTPLLLAGKPERPAQTPAPSAAYDREERAPHREETQGRERARPSERERLRAIKCAPASANAPASECAPSTEDDAPWSGRAGRVLREWKLFASKWVSTWDQARQHRRRHCRRVGLEGVHIGRVDIREDHSYVRLARRHAEADIQGIAEGACGRPGVAHQPGEREAAQAAARYDWSSFRRSAPRGRPGGKGPEVRRVKPKITARRRAKD